MRKIGDDYRIYKIANCILTRTRNPNCDSYHSYGGRGILCKFDGINNLYLYLKTLPNYNSEMTIDRIDNNGHYEKGNMRWVSRKIQQRNRRTNRIVNYLGRNMTFTDAVELSSIPLRTASSRFYTHKWSLERSLTEPFHHENNFLKNK